MNKLEIGELLIFDLRSEEKYEQSHMYGSINISKIKETILPHISENELTSYLDEIIKHKDFKKRGKKFLKIKLTSDSKNV
jgi:rhodanese-related sulfurtransferase